MNPYVPWLTAVPFLEYGRAVILRRITENICQSPPGDLDIHGLPQMGKTALLRYLSTPAYLERHGRQWLLGEFKERPYLLFRLYVTGWTESIHPFIRLHHVYYRAYRTYFEKMAAEHPEVFLPPPAAPAAGANANEALAQLERDVQALSDAGVRPVFLLDDFDKAFEQLDSDQSSRFGSWKEYCSLIFATERLLEDVNSRAKGSPLFKRLPQFPFGTLRPEDARQFLLHPLGDHPLGDEPLGDQPPEEAIAFPPADVDSVLEMAAGFPYLLLLGGQALWEARRQRGVLEQAAAPLPDDARRLLVNQLRLAFGRTYDLYYHSLKPEQQASLQWLARAGSLVMAENPDRLTSQLSLLVAYGLVDIVGGREMRVCSPLLADFLLALDGATPGAARGGPALTGFQRSLYDYLRSRAGQVSAFEELGRSVWQRPAGSLAEDDKRRIHIAMSRLRRQLEATTGERITSLRGQGYRLEPAS